MLNSVPKYRHITKICFKINCISNVWASLNFKDLYCYKWRRFLRPMSGIQNHLPLRPALCTFLFDQYAEYFHSNKLALCRCHQIFVYTYKNNEIHYTYFKKQYIFFSCLKLGSVVHSKKISSSSKGNGQKWYHDAVFKWLFMNNILFFKMELNS